MACVGQWCVPFTVNSVLCGESDLWICSRMYVCLYALLLEHTTSHPGKWLFSLSLMDSHCAMNMRGYGKTRDNHLFFLCR